MSTPSPPPPLLVGFRFRPTDEELVRHYLKPKIAGRPHPDLLFIPDVDLAACEPWDLPAKALIKSDDPEWFFFAPLDRKYPGGHRSNRSTAAGYWKATGKDRLIRSRPAGALIGVKKTLVFHRGRAPRGRRTAWIMHEYRATEPQIQQGQNGRFVLYRLFNKHEEEEETPTVSNSEDADSPPTCSPASANPVVKSENSTHPLTPINDNDQTAPPQENDPLLDVLSHLPDLQPDQAFDGFPTVASPMRPYSDHPFLGDAGGQDLSAYFSSIIAQQQDLEEALSCANGNADMNPTAVLMPSSTTVGDETGDARCSSGTRILQTDTDDGNRDIGGAPDTYIASAQMSHLCKQPQLHSNSAEMEPPSITAQFSAGSWTPYPQQLFDVVEASDTFDGLEGWAAEPMMQQFTVSDLPGPQQGTATRRIRLVHSVTKPVVTSHLESEDEVGSSDSTGNLSTTHDKDYDNLISETTAGEVTRALDGGLLPTQVVSSVEVAEKCCAFSSDEPISSKSKLPNEANLKQRLKQENRKASQNVRDDLQDSGCVPKEPRHRRQQHVPIASAVRLLCLALVVVLAFVCLCKSSLFKYMH